jgi:hypothetical protein
MAEAQAIDRVHRIGQQQDVDVVRYIVNDSIELVTPPSHERLMTFREVGADFCIASTLNGFKCTK